MWLSSLRKLLNRVPVSPICRGRTTARGKSARPRVERLEDRVNPAPPLPPSPTTFTWTGGGGANTNWSNAANWGGLVPATDGTADLVFPTLATQFLTQITTNDFAPDTTFDSITFQGGSYTVLGNPFGLGGNSFIAAGDPNQAPGKSLIVNQPPGYTSNVVIIYPSVVLATRDQTFETNGTGFMQLAVGGHLNNGGFTLTVTGTGNTLLGTVPGLFVSGSLTGDGGLTKTGTGRLTLSGNVPNDYAGLTQVLGGVLHVMKPTALGAPLPPADVDVDATPGLGTTVADGASLWLSFDGLGNIPEEPLTLTGDGVDHFGTMSGALWSINGTNQWGGPITLAGPTTIGVLHAVSPFNPSSLNLTGVVDGGSAATLTKTGAGTLGLFGANTYQGTTTVQEGSLGVANNSALGSSGPTSGTTVNDGASLLLAASPPPMPPPPPPGFPPFFPPPIPTTVAEPLTLGNGTGGTATLTNIPGGGNTWTGPITLRSNAMLGADASTILTVTGDIDTGADAGNNGFLLTVGGPGFVNLLGGVRDAGGVPAGRGGRLTVTGTGRLTLGGTTPNTYSGATTVENGGVLTAAKPSALGHAAGATTVNDGATLLVAPTQVPPPPPPPPGFPPPPPFPLPPPVATTIAAEPLFLGNGTGGTATFGNTLNNNTWGGPVTLASNATVSVTGGQLTLSNAVGESGGVRALTLEGGGFLVLDHANGYSGLTNVNTGMLVIRDSLALGTAAAGTVVGANGRLRLEGNLDISEGLTLNGLGFADIALEPRSGTSTWRGPVHLAGTSNVGVEGRLILDTGITGAPGAGLTRVFGGGVLEFAGSDPNTYSGPTTIKVGTLLLAKDADTTAVAGDLVVSGPIFSPGFPHPVYTGVVELGSDGQIADTATVTVASEAANFNGVFDLKGHTDLIEKLVVSRGTVRNTDFGGRLTLAGAGGTALDMTGGSIDTGSGALFLNGDLTGKAGATIAGEINLGPSGHTFTVAATPGPVLGMTISAKLVGGGGFVKAGPASLVLSGTGDNTYAGTTTVNEGNLLLQRNGVAVGGSLVIGDGVGGLKSDQVSESIFDNQIADWSAVTVNSTGWLILFGRNDTIGALTIDRGTVDTNNGNLGLNGPLAMTGGELDLTAGTLTLGGDVTAAPDPGGAAPVFFGKLDLGGATRTFTVADGPTGSDLNLGDIGGSGGLIKAGDGVLVLSGGGNTYSGTTTVNAGQLYLNSTGLAVPGALVIGDDAGGPGADQVVLGRSDQIADQAVTVNASGELVVSGHGDGIGPLTVNGGSVVTHGGFLGLTGPLAMTGGTVNGFNGTLALVGGGGVTATSDAGGTPARILQGTLDLGTTGRIFHINDGPAADDLVISAALSGANGLFKQGPGKLVLTGNSTAYTGTATINHGTLSVRGPFANSPILPNGSVIVEGGATLGGTGMVMSVTVKPGGIVDPGASPGGITVGGDYTQEAGGILNIEIGGPTPVTEHDQLIVEGTATLGGVLNVSFVNGFVPAVGESFAFLTAGSVVGTFATINGLDLGNNTHLRPVFTAGGMTFVTEPNNQAPTVAVPGAQTAFEDVDLALAGISVGDPDGGHLSVTLGVAHGTLTLGTTAGLTVGGNGTGGVTLSGTVADLNAALATLVFRGALNYGGADALSITADDGVTSTLAGVAINVKSAAQQASDLQAQVTALRTAGVLTQTQANSLNAKLNLTGNVGDVVRVGLFLAEVGVYRLLGVLTQTQASALLQPGGILLVSVTRR